MNFFKNSKNKVLVCIPVYNAEDCLPDTIKSILRQTFNQFDVLIIDNQSTDNTVEVAQQFKRDFNTENEIQIIINKENLGRIGNWNQCIEIFKQTNHSYLKFVFAGDTLKECCLKVLVNVFQKNPGLGFVSSGYYVHISKNNIKKKVSFKKSTHLTPIEALQAFIQKGNWVGAPIACIFSKEVVSGIKFSDGIEWVADWKFYVDIIKRFNSFYISDILGNLYIPQRKYFLEHNNDSVARVEELFIKQYVLQKLEDLNSDVAKNLRKYLYKAEGKCLFQNLSLFDIGVLTIYKLAKRFKNILRCNNS